MPKIIDLTRTLANIPENFPELFKPLARILFPEINYVNHDAGAKIMMQIFNCNEKALPEGKGWAEEDISISSHLGTHVDAPWHYGPVNEHTKYPYIDEIPLEDLYMNACVLDFTDLCGSGALIDIDKLNLAFAKIDLDPQAITSPMAVLINTGASLVAMTEFKYHNYPGLDFDSASYLAQAGFKIIGTDATGIDRPFLQMAQDFHKTQDKKHILGAHFALQGQDIYILQQLTNLKSVPPKNFKIACFPLKFKNASAAPARIVAFVD